MIRVNRFAVKKKISDHLTECKRFAGHSKWANIKHTKMAKDAERSNALQTAIKKMRFAIAGTFLYFHYFILN